MAMHVCSGCVQHKLILDRYLDPCDFIKADEILSCPCITCLVKPICKEFCSIYYGSVEYYGLKIDDEFEENNEY
jgi:hypothetical protein